MLLESPQIQYENVPSPELALNIERQAWLSTEPGQPPAHLVLADPVAGGVGRQAGVPQVGGVLRVGWEAARGRIYQFLFIVLWVVPALDNTPLIAAVPAGALQEGSSG